MPKFYVTSRCLTDGIETVTAALGSDAMAGLIWWRLAPEGGVRTAGPGEWFTERSEAVEDANNRRHLRMEWIDDQLTALEAEFTRLEALTFDAPAGESE